MPTVCWSSALRGRAASSGHSPACGRAHSSAPVPLSTLVTTDNLQVGPLSVSHQGQFPAVTISFNLPKGVALGQSIDAIDKAVTAVGFAV